MSSLPLMELREIQLLKKEVEALGEALSKERLDRQIELEQLKMEFEAVKQVMQTHLPTFKQDYETTFNEIGRTEGSTSLRTGT